MSGRVPRRRGLYRALEILPGALTWSFLTLPVLFSFIFPVGVAYFILIFDIYWLFKSINTATLLYRAYRRMRWATTQDWRRRMQLLMQPDELAVYLETKAEEMPPWARQEESSELETVIEHRSLLRDPSRVWQVVIVPTFRESLEVLETTVGAIVRSDYPMKRVILVVAVEERDRERGLKNAEALQERFGSEFYHFLVTVHPADTPGEIKGKGPNITYAGREMLAYIEEQGIDPEDVIVTSLDADHRPHPSYFAYLTYKYCTTPNPEAKTFQPMQVASNNIWDAPAVNRMVAFGTSFWLFVEAVRPRRLRNYSTQAQSLKALIATDFWSVTSVVEDGHQYWRTYFTYQGDYKVVPIFVPVYIDAVLSGSYWQTLKAQYLQMRRWAWGAGDIAFVITNFRRHPEIPWSEKVVQTTRLMEGHLSWATASLYLTVVAWLPPFLNQAFQTQVIAHTLGPTASLILTLALVGQIVSVLISGLLLPERPVHRRRVFRLAMYAQWVMLPVVTIVFSSFPVIDAQTRLMLGRYMEVFNVTEKVRKGKVSETSRI